jgi:hypothetical protein
MTETVKAEKAEKVEKFKKPSKSSITRQGILEGLTDEQVMDAINAVYPGEAKITCVRWYRYQDPVVTGKSRTGAVKKSEIYTAFKAALELKTPVEQGEILLGLVEKHFDTFISKINVAELTPFIPEELLPQAPVKKENAPKEPKEPKAKKIKKAEVAAESVEGEVVTEEEG